MAGLKKVFGVLLCFSLAQVFVCCDDSSDTPVSAEPSEVEVRHIVDTVYVTDTVRVFDGAASVDSVNVIERIRTVDDVHILDSIVLADSVRILDSVQVKDSILVRDSVAVRDVEYFLGECTAKKADTMMLADVNGEDRYFVCDGRTLLWRSPTNVDWNNLYVKKSAVKDFTPLETVIENLAEDERLAVMLRHAERGSDYSDTGPLNSNGVKQSTTLGEKLVGDLEFYYAASPATRTHQTCSNIAKARGEVDTLAETIDFLGGTWFVKDSAAYAQYKSDHSGSWNVTSKWLFEGSYADAFYDLAPRCTQYLDSIIFPALEKSGKRVGLFISHDLVLLPLVVYISQRNIDMRYYSSSSKRWLNYLAGLAVVIKPDGSFVFYAVKGLDSGTMKE